MPDLLDRALALSTGSRKLIALAGPPASGKSTQAAILAEALNARGRDAVVVPMDGFHLDNAVLEARGLLPRKGAPETFDLRGFAALLGQLTEGGEVFFPLFDRDRELAVCAADVVPSTCDLVIVEGNYLLYDSPGWRDLVRFWDLSVFLDVAEAELRARLVQRWLDQGHTVAEAEARARANDLPNARAVTACRLDAMLTLTS